MFDITSKLTTADRVNEINSDISKMIKNLEKFHQRNSQKNPEKLNIGRIGDISEIAKNLEKALYWAGLIKEKDLKYGWDFGHYHPGEDLDD